MPSELYLEASSPEDGRVATFVSSVVEAEMGSAHFWNGAGMQTSIGGDNGLKLASGGRAAGLSCCGQDAIAAVLAWAVAAAAAVAAAVAAAGTPAFAGPPRRLCGSVQRLEWLVTSLLLLTHASYPQVAKSRGADGVIESASSPGAGTRAARNAFLKRSSPRRQRGLPRRLVRERRRRPSVPRC